MAAVTADSNANGGAIVPSSLDQPASAAGHRFTAAHDACQSFMSRFHQQKKVDPFAGQPSFSIGPVDLYAGSLVKQFRVRQKVELSDRLSAAAGLYYDLGTDKLGPWGLVTYKLDPDNPNSKSRIELNSLDKRLLLRKGWEFNVRNATVGVSAEARLNLVQDAAAGGSKGGSSSTSGSSGSYSLRPDLHISLDHVKPLQYELIGIGLVLLLGLPLSLNNKEGEVGMPWGLGRLRGFARASVKRSEYMRYKLGVGETSGVLEL